MNKDRIHPNVVIIGGGPAGCSAALTLLNQTSLTIAIIEATNYENFRVGESVSPGFISLLRYLKVDENFSSDLAIPSHGIETSWGSPNLQVRDFFFTGQGNGWNLDRGNFDKMLAEEVIRRNGIILAKTKVVKSKKEKNGWSILIKNKNGVTQKIFSDFIIDASGKKASLARDLGTKWVILDYLVAIAAVYEIQQAEDQPHTLLESVSFGWWYSTLIPCNRRIVVFMTDSDISKQLKYQILENWKTALIATSHIKKTIKNSKIIRNPQIFSAYSQIIKKTTHPLWIPAGDALASFDPLSSIGIGHAIVSGIESARIAFDTLEFDGKLANGYFEKEYNIYCQYLNNRKHFYDFEKRWIESPFWKRRQEKVKSSFLRNPIN